MLDPEELLHTAARFGVSDLQVRRDHLISHILAALSTEVPDSVIFFGGTALARSLVPDGRLSEDVDLIALGSRTEIGTHLTNAILGPCAGSTPD